MGIFVGGGSSRMGRFPKGLLQSPSGKQMNLVEHWCELARQLSLDCVLVGESAAYSHLGLPSIPDQPPGIGPIGGLRGFLAHVHGKCSTLAGIAVACDMPYVTTGLLARLCSHPSQRPILAPRDPLTQTWEPLFARYLPSPTLPLIAECHAERRTSLQGLLDRASAEILPLLDTEWAQLRDWDQPSDIQNEYCNS